jgi:hypothetical protein
MLSAAMKRRALLQLAACIPALMGLPSPAVAEPETPKAEPIGELWLRPGEAYTVRPAGPDGSFVRIMSGSLMGAVVSLDALMRSLEVRGGSVCFLHGDYRLKGLLKVPKGHALGLRAPEYVGKFPSQPLLFS